MIELSSVTKRYGALAALGFTALPHVASAQLLTVPRMGVTVDYVDGRDLAAMERALVGARVTTPGAHEESRRHTIAPKDQAMPNKMPASKPINSTPKPVLMKAQASARS